MTVDVLKESPDEYDILVMRSCISNEALYSNRATDTVGKRHPNEVDTDIVLKLVWCANSVLIDLRGREVAWKRKAECQEGARHNETP